jgi:cyclase
MDTRIIPCLQLEGDRLVKTVRFENPGYIGDPVNTVRIFNELEVDELCFLDIRATLHKKAPDYSLLQQIADECFMPLSFGGGIADFETAKKVFSCGYEKIILNSAALANPQLIRRLADHFGSQAIIVSIDVKKTFLGRYRVMARSGTLDTGKDPVQWAAEAESLGAGELLVTSIAREGTWKGFDLSLVSKISAATSLPVIAHGGAGSPEDIRDIFGQGGASAAGIGSLFLFQKKEMGVLINYPKEKISEACS